MTVTLHGHKSQFEPFYLGRNAAILFHSTLRDLTISCVDFEADITLDDIPLDRRRTTALRSLTFIECNIYLPLLSVALSLPRSLKRLCINERLHALDGCLPKGKEDLPRTSHPQFLVEINKHADSLEHLTYSNGNPMWMQHYPNDPYGESKLRQMRVLKHLELDLGSTLCYYFTENGLPEGLEKVMLFDAALSNTRFDRHAHFQVVLDAAHQLVIKRLSRAIDLDICWTAILDPLGYLDTIRSNPHAASSFQHLRIAVYAIAAILKARGARLRLFAEYFPGGHTYIPPYMYGEDTPKRFLVYDSEHMFTFFQRRPDLSGEEANRAGVLAFSAWDYRQSDAHELPRELVAICKRCHESKLACDNDGYGTGCMECVANLHKCDYAPPTSAWTANALGRDEPYEPLNVSGQ